MPPQSRRTATFIDTGIVLLFAAFAIVLYRAPLFEGAAPYFCDFQVFFAPMKGLLVDAMRQGEWAFWNPHVQGGTPFLADPQSGVLYPPSLLLLLAELPRALALSLAFHLTLGQFGSYLLARAHGCDRPAAVAAAAVYGLGGWMISSGNMMNVLQAAAWAPWVLLTFERLWAAPSPGRIALATVPLSLQVLAGSPDIVIMTALVAMLRRLFIPGLLRWQWLAASLLAGLLAALLCMPQLLSTWEAYTLSTRVGGLSDQALFEFSATLGQLRSLLLPPALQPANWNIFDLYPDGHVPLFLTLYVGWIAMLLSLCAPLGMRRIALFWVAVAGSGIFLALGPQNPLAVPLLRLMDRLRSPEKYLFLLHWGLAMLAGAGLQQLLVHAQRLRPRWPIALAGTAVAALLVTQLLAANSRIDLHGAPDHYRLERLPEVALLQAEPGRLYARSTVPDQVDTVRELYAGLRADLSPNLGALARVSYLNGTYFLSMHQQALATELVEKLPPGYQLATRLGFFASRYVVSSDPSFTASADWSFLAKQLTPRLWMLPDAAPLLGFPQTVVQAPDDFLFTAIDLPDFASGHSAFVASDTMPAADNLRGQLHVVNSSANRMEATVTTPTGGLVVWRQQIYPGWQAELDGHAAPLIRADHFFMALRVPPGEHRIRFRFEPTTWQLGWWLAATAAALLAVLAGLELRRSRRAGKLLCLGAQYPGISP